VSGAAAKPVELTALSPVSVRREGTNEVRIVQAGEKFTAEKATADRLKRLGAAE
jgi:hypothetical protein